MDIIIRDKKYHLWWEFEKEVHEKEGNKETKYLGKTKCNIKISESQIISATASLHHKDRFEKIKGRKESLKKLIDTLRDFMNLSKSDREKIWKQYLNQPFAKKRKIKKD